MILIPVYQGAEADLHACNSVLPIVCGFFVASFFFTRCNRVLRDSRAFLRRNPLSCFG